MHSHYDSDNHIDMFRHNKNKIINNIRFNIAFNVSIIYSLNAICKMCIGSIVLIAIIL